MTLAHSELPYIDGYVLAVPNSKRDAYHALAKASGPSFKAHGALQVAECWGEDVPDGKLWCFLGLSGDRAPHAMRA